jgi:hypothetical protein
MRILAGLGVGAFFVVGLLVSLRLLGLWRRTRRLPELLVALALLCLGPLAFTLGVLAARLAPGSPELARPLSAAASAAAVLGAAAAAWFTIVVFRHESRAARAVAAVLVAAMVVCWAGVGATNGYDVRLAPGAFRYAGQLLRLGILLWASLESLVYWRLMRRRLALGLADPLTTGRFALWGAGLGAGSAAMAIAFFGNVFGLRYTGYGPLFELSIAAAGLAAAACLLLAFLPPARYRAAVERRAAARVT